MRISTLAKTNIIIICILSVGFFLLLGIYYTTSYKDILEQEKHLTKESIAAAYSKLSEFFILPVSVSQTMAKDVFLISFLSDEKFIENEDSTDVITQYLKGYKTIYGFDGDFLSLIKTNALYTQDGLIAHVKDDVNHKWYEKAIATDKDYDMNIDVDKTPSANMDPSLFVNHKIKDDAGNLIGFTGICVHLKTIMKILKDYEVRENKKIYIIDENGIIQVSKFFTGLSNENLFKREKNNKISSIVKEMKNKYENNGGDEEILINQSIHKNYGIKYIPGLEWYMVVENSTQSTFQQFRKHVLTSALIITGIVLAIIFFISKVIKKFEYEMKVALEERLQYFHDAARYIHTNIYEINLDTNSFVKESRLHQFDTIKDENEHSYSKSMEMLARKAIKEEYQDEFIKTFNRDNLQKLFEQGQDSVSFDCQTFIDNRYQWLRYDVHLFRSKYDQQIHFYMYSKNINEERENEIRSQLDSLTQCFTRGITEETISRYLTLCSHDRCVFFMIDIDNFKTANDTYGHAFGDLCIRTFAQTIKKVFRRNEIIGRIGGDEFVVFLQIPSDEVLHRKARQLVEALDQDCIDGNKVLHLSASIGIAVSPKYGTTFDELYRNADAALYQVKQNGKNGYAVFNDQMSCTLSGHDM